MPVADFTEMEKLTGLYTREAIEFIEQAEDKPFFLYFAHTYPHQPLHASENFRGKSKGGLYGDTIEEIDWSLGELVKTLKANGQWENTLVIFTSDNGAWYNGSAGKFRGRKGQSYEGGYRIPMIAHWPEKIPQGTVCDFPAMNIDWFPTCLALAGVELPKDRIIDGKDISGLLTGAEKDPRTMFSTSITTKASKPSARADGNSFPASTPMFGPCRSTNSGFGGQRASSLALRYRIRPSGELQPQGQPSRHHRRNEA